MNSVAVNPQRLPVFLQGRQLMDTGQLRSDSHPAEVLLDEKSQIWIGGHPAFSLPGGGG